MKVFEFSILHGELWWGGRVCDSGRMPIGEADIFYADLADNGYNQATPFFLSNQGRFLWCDAPFAISANNGEVICKGEVVVEMFEGFQDLRGALLAARAKFFPPPEAIPSSLLFTAPQYNTWIELMYGQEETAILSYAQRLIDEGYPPGVLMIDDNWQEDYGVWKFHEGRFRDPRGMIRRLHELGFLVMLWICPFVSPDSENFRHLRKTGALVLQDNGKPFFAEWWNGHSAVLDLTRPAGREWFEGSLRHLCNAYGVDGFKFDAGDLPYYPSEAVRHLEEFARLGAQFSLNEFRAAWKSADLPIAQRLADRNHAWDMQGLGAVLPGLVAQGLLGYPFVCPDMIGGGQYESFLGSDFAVDAELVVRYAQAAALCPMMQFSVAPWRILNTEHAAFCREAALVHLRFGGEILKLAEVSARTGEPIMRSMEYQFPGMGYASVRDQFLLGEALLVAPVMQKGQFERQVVLPPGHWRDDEGSDYKGPQTVAMQAPLRRLIWLKLI